MTPGLHAEHLPLVGGAVTLPAEYGRVGLLTCAICGAALVLDPTHKVDVVELHRLWHEDHGQPHTADPHAQSDWPAHLRDDAPYLVCDVCQRKTWGTDHEVGTRCEMTQPNGRPCHGHFVNPAARPDA